MRIDRLSALQDLAKWTALLTMTLDHVGSVLFPEALFLRFVGRFAWPLFALLVGVNLGARRVPVMRYLPRLVVWALPAQLAFLLLGWQEASILVTLALGVVLWGVVQGELRWPWAFLLLGSPLVQYGTAGVLLVPVLAALSVRYRHEYAVAALLLTLLSQGSFFWAVQTFIQLAAAMTALVVTFALLGRSRFGLPSVSDLVALVPRVPRQLGYAFYPLHLLAVWSLSVVAPAVPA